MLASYFVTKVTEPTYDLSLPLRDYVFWFAAGISAIRFGSIPPEGLPPMAAAQEGASVPASAPASAPVAPAVQQQPTAGSAELGEQLSPQKVRDMALRRLQLAVRDFASVCEAQGLPEYSVSGDLAIARRAEQAVFPSARTRPLQATDDLGFVTPVKRPRLSFPKLTKSSVAGRPSGLTKPALPEHTSRAGPSVAAGGLFKPPRLPASFPTSVVKPSRRSFSTRRVSPDLPYSLVVADSAGFQQPPCKEATFPPTRL